MLVNEYVNPLYQCVDIETDFNQFYFKFAKKIDQVEKKSDVHKLEFQIRQVRHFWRNRVSFQTSKRKRNADCWDTILHKRIAKYFKLYT